MPIKLDTFVQDALLILIDYNKRKSSKLKLMLEQLLRKNQWVYSDGTESGSALVSRVGAKQEENELGKFSRIIFLHDVNVGDLDDAWMEHYRDIMRQFDRGARPANPSDHYHVTFMRYRNNNTLSEREKEEIRHRILSFWDGSIKFRATHMECICYQLALGGSLDGQEEGMAYFSYLMTKDVFWNTLNPTALAGKLCVIQGNHHSSEKVKIYEEKIQKLEQWLGEARDVTLEQFYMDFHKTMSDWIRIYAKGREEIEAYKGLYPSPLRNYVADGALFWKKYRKKENIFNEELESEKQRYRKEYLNRLRKKPLSDWKEIQEESMYYLTFKKLRQNWNDGGAERYIDTLLEEFKELSLSERQDFMKLAEEYLYTFISERDNEEQKQVKEEELFKIHKELGALPFKSLKDCLENIGRKTNYQIPPAVGVGDINKWALISPEVAYGWKRDSLSGVLENHIYRTALLDSNEIVYIRLGSCMRAEDEPERILEFIIE